MPSETTIGVYVVRAQSSAGSTAGDPVIPSPRRLEWPPIGIVIATRERPHLVRRALASVSEQDYAGPIRVVVGYDAANPYWLPAPRRHRPGPRRHGSTGRAGSARRRGEAPADAGRQAGADPAHRHAAGTGALAPPTHGRGELRWPGRGAALDDRPPPRAAPPRRPGARG